MKRFICAVMVLFVLSLFGTAWAQMGMKTGPTIYGEFKPVVGGWSEYQVVAKGSPGQQMKLAIVGKEGDAFWYETVSEGKEGKVIYKMLVSGNPNDEKALRRVIFKQGNNPAMELPVKPVGRAPKGDGKKAKMVDKGIESIKVPAGTFKARHLQYEGRETVDVWVDEKVSPYGLVKSKSKDVEITLLGYGTGAKTLITERPQKFQIPKMQGR